MRQKGGSRGAALFLLLLAALSAAEPLLRSAALPAPSGLPASASAAPISEEAFVRRLAGWLETEDKFLKKMSEETAETLGKALAGEPLHIKLPYAVPRG
jgi:hypothetical protein